MAMSSSRWALFAILVHAQDTIIAKIDNQYLHKGQLVFVEGRLRPEVRIWTGNDGNPRASYELTAERVLFLGGNRSNSETIMEHGAPVGEVDESEIPF